MKNNHTAWLIFKRSMTILFVIFVILYFQVETGSSNYIRNKTIITQENIEKFEKDIKEGEYIDIKNYIEENNVDTSNAISNAGYIVSEKASKFIGEELVKIFKFIGNLIT